MSLLPFLNLTLASAGLLMLVATIVLAVDYFAYDGRYASRYVELYAWPTLMLLTGGSLVLSLLYSEYFGFIPCSLCWLQRIAIYPQALLSIIAYKMKDTAHYPIYGISLSIFGLLVALYHYLDQMLPNSAGTGGILPCLADGTNADCAVRVIDEFGFVTFPLISAFTFALLIMIYLYQWRAQQARTSN